MATEITMSLQTRTWLAGLSPMDRARIVPAIEALKDYGGELNRRDKQLSKPIKSSRFPEMSELRSKTGNLRILYAMSSDNRARLLIGGDKTNNWRGWYLSNVPKADRLYDGHLRRHGREGQWPTRTTGERGLGR